MSVRAQAEHRGSQSPVGCHRPQPGAQVRLVAFAHAGAGPLTFHRWAVGLAPDVELWHATLPGRAARWREPFSRDWTTLVDELAAAIERDVPRPLALLGHSLGALLAFEVARRLTHDGVPLAHLVVSGRGAPDTAPALQVPETDDELLRHVDRLVGGVPDSVRSSPDVLEHFLPILRADLELARAYVFTPGARLDCPITAMTGDADPIAPPSSIEAWGEQTVADCDLCVLPGGHFYLVDQEPAVLATISRRLIG